jgi:hypothetical protein
MGGSGQHRVSKHWDTISQSLFDGNEEPMKPTHEQTERVKMWLDDRLHALFRGDPFPPWPATIEEDLRNGVDFSDLFAEYGFTADSSQLLPNFYEIQRKAGRAFKT